MQGIQVQSLVREQAPTWHVSWPKGGNKGDFPSNSVSMTCTKDSSACGLRWTQFYFIIWLWAMACEQRNGLWLKKKQYNTPMVQREIDSVGVEMMCLLQGEKLRCIPSRFRKMCLGQQDPWTSRWDNRVRLLRTDPTMTSKVTWAKNTVGISSSAEEGLSTRTKRQFSRQPQS